MMIMIIFHIITTTFRNQLQIRELRNLRTLVRVSKIKNVVFRTPNAAAFKIRFQRPHPPLNLLILMDYWYCDRILHFRHGGRWTFSRCFPLKTLIFTDYFFTDYFISSDMFIFTDIYKCTDAFQVACKKSSVNLQKSINMKSFVNMKLSLKTGFKKGNVCRSSSVTMYDMQYSITIPLIHYNFTNWVVCL